MNPLLYTLIALSLLVTGLRAQAQALPATAVGAVGNVFVRDAPGVFNEKTLPRRAWTRAGAMYACSPRAGAARATGSRAIPKPSTSAAATSCRW
ncbi:MAG: hypothetical protein ACK59Y_08055 [Betaproteobacteria bacterium]|nr:hypothetical protein [Betaproteobacteria bacterium]